MWGAEVAGGGRLQPHTRSILEYSECSSQWALRNGAIMCLARTVGQVPPPCGCGRAASGTLMQGWGVSQSGLVWKDGSAVC